MPADSIWTEVDNGINHINVLSLQLIFEAAKLKLHLLCLVHIHN
jgi:hypothetical protein